MNYIRKYNESLEDEVDKEYVDMCFIDFVDDNGRYYSEFDNKYKCLDITIGFDVSFEQGASKPFTFSIEMMKKYNLYKLNIYEDIGVCLNKVKIEFPNYYYAINENVGEIYIKIHKEKKMLTYKI